MKICDISSFYSELGGGVRTYHHHKLAWFEAHPEHSYSMIVAGPRNETQDVPGGRIHRTRGIPVSRKGGYRQIADFFEVKRVLEAERPDVIEIGSAYLDCWLALGAGLDWAPVVSGFYHADFPDSYMAPAVSGLPRALGQPFVDFWKRYVKFTYGRFDVTCVTSRYIERKLRAFGVDNTFLVPLGVDADHFRPALRDEAVRRAHGVGPGERLALCVGRFSSEKGVDVLCEAIVRLAGRDGLHILLVGDGPLERQVRDAAAANPRARILGYVSDRDVLARLHAAADVFLAPGPYETFGLSALEALSSGVPVVAAASGGAAETVGASAAGRLFKPHDAADFVRCLEHLLADDLEALGRRARRFVEDGYSWDGTFRRMVDRYGELHDEKTARPAGAARRDPGPRAVVADGLVPPGVVGSPAASAPRRPESPRTLAAL
jgi:alpha-1,6-mannosyltransferase